MHADKPTFYSRIFIAIYTLFMTPIGGAILLVINLKNSGKKKYIPWVLAGALVYEALHILLIWHYQPVGSLLFFGPLFLGAILLAFPLWHVLLDGLMFYDQKPVLGPLLIMLCVWGAAIAGIYTHIF